MTRILIIKPSSLGDIVHGLVVAQSLREQCADCSIAWVAAEMFAPLVEACPTVDHTIVFPRHGGPRAWLRFVRELRHEHYDCVLDFQGLARSGLMTLAARADRKIGRRDAREGARFAYHERVALPTDKKHHAIEFLLQFLPQLGLEARLGNPIRIIPEPLAPPQEALTSQHPIVLVPHSREPVKEWPGFAQLTQLLLAAPTGPPVIWTSHKRCASPPPIASHPRFHNLTGNTTLRQMIGLIQAAQLVVTNDSGPLHIAAALGIPLVACFGPTPPERFGPYPLDRPIHRILRAPDGDLSRLEVSTVHAAVMASLLASGT